MREVAALPPWRRDCPRGEPCTQGSNHPVIRTRQPILHETLPYKQNPALQAKPCPTSKTLPYKAREREPASENRLDVAGCRARAATDEHHGEPRSRRVTHRPGSHPDGTILRRGRGRRSRHAIAGCPVRLSRDQIQSGLPATQQCPRRRHPGRRVQAAVRHQCP
jgi:hypothetical protein